MPSLLTRLKERRLVQWTLAYLAGAWFAVQVLDALREPWGIPDEIYRSVTILLGVGAFAAVVIAWYHGEKGRQRVSGPELLILAGVAVIAGLLVSLVEPDGAAAPETGVAMAMDNTVAVLPFLDLSLSGDQQHFSDGVAVEIISALRRDGRVRVSGQSSSFAMRGRPAREVGVELSVASVLEGSVRTEGDSMRVTASLSNAADGFEIWTLEFDRPIANILQTQAEIAAAVVEGITGETAAVAAGIGTIDPEAYELYVRGRLAWDRRTEADLILARDYFQRAIDIAPDFAPARSGLADAYAVAGFYQYLSPDEAFPAARREAEAALAIDPESPEALATQAYVTLYYDWDWEAAEAGFRAAIAAADGYHTAHQWLANVLLVTGDVDGATREFEHAFERDPGSMIARVGVPWTRYYARDYEASLAGIDDVIRLDDRYMLAHYWRGWVLQQMGRMDEAITSLDTAVELSDSSGIALAGLAGAYARAGREAEARSLLTRLRDVGLTPNPPLYEIAKVYLALGDTDTAFEWFDRAFDGRALQLIFVGVDPEVDPVRADPRFEDLLRRLKLD